MRGWRQKGRKRKQDGEVGVPETVIWRNSHKAMLRPNESMRCFDFLKKIHIPVGSLTAG